MLSIRYLELKGSNDTFSFTQVSGSGTLSVDSSQYGWLGAIGLKEDDRKNTAWGYPRQETGLNTIQWSKLITEAKDLFIQWGGADKFVKMELEQAAEGANIAVDLEAERQELLKKIGYDY